jgi:hypothetical protein
MPKTDDADARSRKTPKGGITDRARIRELFLKRQPYYVFADVLRLTRFSEAELVAALTVQAVTPEIIRGFSVLPWSDVATLALERWTPRMMDAALDMDRLDVIPPLNRVQHMDAFLPLYQIRLLHHLAEKERGAFRARLNVSDVLERRVLDLASSMEISDAEDAIPGFREALRYPYFIPRADDISTAFCRYCGRFSGVPGRQMCDDCIGRHEPKPHMGAHGVPELDVED